MTTPLNPIARLDVPLERLEADLNEMLRLKMEAANRQLAAEEAAFQRSLRLGWQAENRHLLHDADPASTVPVFRVSLIKGRAS